MYSAYQTILAGVFFLASYVSCQRTGSLHSLAMVSNRSNTSHCPSGIPSPVSITQRVMVQMYMKRL